MHTPPLSFTLRRVMENSKPLSKQRKHYVAHLAFGALSSFMLTGALLFSFPYGYYSFLKIVVFATSGIFASTTNSVARIWMFVLFALVYNPIVPVKGIQKGMWMFINFVTILAIVISLYVEYHENEKEAAEENESGE